MDLKLYDGDKLIADTVIIKDFKYLKLIDRNQEYPIDLFGWGDAFTDVVSYLELYDWGTKRIFPKDRVDARRILDDMKLHSYDPNKILKQTEFRYICDDYWVKGWR